LPESIVEWVLTDALENAAIGTADSSVNDARIHEVKIEGLTRFTKNFYRVKTSATISDIYIFKTPPFASDQESFQNYMVALYSVAYMIKMTLKKETNPPKSYIELCLK